jgi:hypothetical protein
MRFKRVKFLIMRAAEVEDLMIMLEKEASMEEEK